MGKSYHFFVFILRQKKNKNKLKNCHICNNFDPSYLLFNMG